MSKTAQKKRQCYRDGQNDYRKYKESFSQYYPAIYRKHYVEGYNDAKAKAEALKKRSEKRTFLQWVKYLFLG